MRHHPTISRLQFVKLCECGCGQPTLLAALTNSRLGHVRGVPLRFISGHYHRALRRKRPTRPHISRKGYVFHYVPDHPYAHANGYVAEHRLVMEKMLGRYLPLRRDTLRAMRLNRDAAACSRGLRALLGRAETGISRMLTKSC